MEILREKSDLIGLRQGSGLLVQQARGRVKESVLFNKFPGDMDAAGGNRL